MLNRKIIYLLTLLIIFTGCAYFNTYYNANKLFKEAQEIGFDEQGRPKSNAIQKYNQVIKKCGVILTDYKNSKWADDALFLLASSFYYKGNSYTLAIEKFNDIINFYPDSKYVPDSYIYIARSNYKFNKKEKAYQQLQNFINDPQFKQKHPQAILVLANYYLENEDLIEANYYFQQIIDRFPDSEVYQDAFFLQGKTFHVAGNYLESNRIFNDLLDSRINKKIKLDARYYIALNLLLLDAPEESYKVIKKLKKDEYRTDNLPKIQMLEARCLSETGDIEAAISLFETIKNQNKNSLIAAEASYFLAETYFTKLQDYDNAIAAYSDVNKQNKKSEYVELAVSRRSVIGEIIQYNNPETGIPTSELINQKLKLAEYYIEVLDLPDSALSIYDKITREPEQIRSRLDTLSAIRKAYEDNISSLQDSLAFDTTSTSLDSLETDSIQDTMIIDSLSTDALIDSSRYVFIPENDSLKAVSPSELDELIRKLNSDLDEYRSDYIPFARFVQTWIYTSLKQDTLKAERIYQLLLRDSSDHPYTSAAEALISGKEAELVDVKIKQDTNRYQDIQNLLSSDPDSAYFLLTQLSDQDDFTYFDKANFTLGIYCYESGDTSSARLHFDRVLQRENNAEFVQEINKIYDGSDFLITERLNYFLRKEAEVDSLEVEVDIESDSTDFEKSELIVNPRTDSLQLNRPALILERSSPPAPKTLELSEKKILLEMEVLADGRVGMIRILNDIKLERDLIEYVESTVRSWKFQPALENGQPVKSVITDTLELVFD